MVHLFFRPAAQMPSLAPKACLSICYVILLRLCRYPTSRNELYSFWSVNIHVLDDFFTIFYTEIYRDVRDSGFFDRFRPGSTVHADGNRAWKSEARRRSIKFASVAHNKMQFTKRHSKTRLTRTQALDKVWSHLKRSVPKSLCSRSKSDRRFNPRMEQYVYSYMWRFNNRNWWKQLGELCKQR